MEHASAEELHVVVYHLPLEVVATGSPVVVVDCLVAVDGDKVVFGVCREVTVKIVGCDYCLLVLCEAACRFLHYGEHLWHCLVELILVDVEDFFLQLVNLLKELCTLVYWRVFYLLLNGGYLRLLLLRRRLNAVLNLFRLCTEGIVVELLYLRRSSFDFLYKGLD